MRKTKQQQNRQLFLIYGIIYVFLVYLCIVFAPYWTGTLIDSLPKMAAMPKSAFWHLQKSPYTFSMILIVTVIYAIVILVYHSSRRNTRFGEEQGSSQWGDVNQITKKYQRKKPICYTIEKEENGKVTQEKVEVAFPNLILTKKMLLSIDAQSHRRNLNVLVIGGSGAGKTMFYARPNLLQANTGYIVLDPKGELIEDCGGFLKKQGYTVWVLDLKNPENSDGYNPFDFLETEDDVLMLVDNLFDNTTDKDARKGEQIWDDAAKALLRSLIFYVREMLPPEQQNFSSVMKYLRRAKTEEDEMGNPKPSQLDGDMLVLQWKLEKSNRKAETHPAYRAYQEYRSGAAKTMQSVLFTLNARLSKFNVQSISNLTSHNDLKLKRMGKEKIAIFAVIPDDTPAYNFLVGILYTQLFQQLYRSADLYPGKKLPVPVHFLMDEFANVALPDDYCSLLSTMRSREISSVIIIQNLAQLKALFKDTWETIPGNCDTLVYLGGNEQSTHEYISKLLGKSTIDKKSSGETRGRQGSSSRNYDVLGREIMMPDEVRKMDNKKCLIFIRGFDPILDDKFSPFGHPMFAQSADGEGEPYVHVRNSVSEDSVTEPAFTILNDKALSYYEELQKKGEQVYIDKLSYEEFLLLGQVDLKKRFMDMDEAQTVEEFHEEQAKELMYAQDEKEEASNNIPYRLMHMSFTKEQKAELQRAMDVRVPKDIILSYFYPDTPVTRMMEIRRQYESAQ